MHNFILLFLLLGFVPACKPSQPKAVAMVNSSFILRDDFQEELRRVRAETGDLVLQKEVLASLKSSVLNQMIEKRLVLDQADAYHVAVSDSEVDARIRKIQGDYPVDGFDKAAKENFVNMTAWRARLRDGLLMEKIMHEAVSKHLEPDDEELLRYFRAHAGDFSLADRIHLRQIVVRNRDEAEAIRVRVLKGELFTDLARKHSLTPDAEQGGDIGTFARGEMPPEFNQAFGFKVGEVSPVVQSSYGYHLFWVIEKLSARIPPLEEVQAQVRERLLQERKENAYRDWIKHLREEAGVRIMQEELDEIN